MAILTTRDRRTLQLVQQMANAAKIEYADRNALPSSGSVYPGNPEYRLLRERHNELILALDTLIDLLLEVGTRKT